jgi:hypothetical protein
MPAEALDSRVRGNHAERGLSRAVTCCDHPNAFLQLARQHVRLDPVIRRFS